MARYLWFFFCLFGWKLLFLCRLVCSFPRREREECLFSRGADSSYILTRVRLKFFCRKSSAEKTNTNFVSKTHFFLISSSLSRAQLRAYARAYNITFFLRARAHAREKVTRIAIIDKSLSMIVGGRVGALFFIVCFLSVLEIQIERFCISPPAWQMNEWKELGKNGQRGFEYGEFWLARASFSPFLCSFLCRRVIAYLLSSSSKKKSTTTHGGKSIFWERIPAFHFLKRDLSTVGGVLYRLKSRVLSFFFSWR